LKSRRPEELYARLEHLVYAGSAEIQLCAQDTAVYGTDISITLLDLIERFGSVKGDFMMRIGMMNPASVMRNKESILAAFQNDKVFKFLHLPVQTGSDPMLEAMGRHHTVAEFENLVAEFRKRFPNMSLSTDIIVGFPGETDEDFRKSVELIGRVEPDIVNITRFSSRPGTKAHSMRPRVPSRIAKDRSRLLTELRFSLSNANYNRYQGQTLKAIATERRMKGSTFLRTVEYKPVVVQEVVDLGLWYNLEVTGNEKTHLTGKFIRSI
jgi:MiaB/RimO family radical SAM methylthiotransferase